MQESDDGPEVRELTSQDGLQLTAAVIENENLPDRRFKNLIAGMSRTIPTFLQSEGEEYGMTS